MLDWIWRQSVGTGQKVAIKSLREIRLSDVPLSTHAVVFCGLDVLFQDARIGPRLPSALGVAERACCHFLFVIETRAGRRAHFLVRRQRICGRLLGFSGIPCRLVFDCNRGRGRHARAQGFSQPSRLVAEERRRASAHQDGHARAQPHDDDRYHYRLAQEARRCVEPWGLYRRGRDGQGHRGLRGAGLGLPRQDPRP